MAQIPQEAWKRIIHFCTFENFLVTEPEVIFQKMAMFIKDIDGRSERFSKSGRPEVARIVSGIKLVLQKARDDLVKYTPLLLKMLSLETFITDKNEEFRLSKEDFSYYFALDY